MALLKKNSFPWMEKGDWYYFFFEHIADGEWKLTTGDLELEKVYVEDDEETQFFFPFGFRVLDVISDETAAAGGTASKLGPFSLSDQIGDGLQYFMTLDSTLETLALYVFGYKE